MQLLYPDCRPTSPAELAAGLRLAEKALPERPYLILNMVSSLDGKATIEWRTKGLSTDLDRELFHRLRTQVDAVMVGAGTVRIERYGRMTKSDELRQARVDEGLSPDPRAVVVSARLDLPADLPLLNEPEQQVVIATGSDASLPDMGDQVVYERTGEDLPLLMARLRERHGVRSVLCEGGPTLNSHLLSAGVVDELWLTLNPKLAGGAAALTIVAGRELVEPLELEPISIAEGGGDLFTRWRVRQA
ncbi:MAG TPA: dihydrofolate reductase family protein [Thermoleophilaceae bacterium]|jgi:5-amino-6-(5-phosphoribosylamino)uracil reductase|nr:dihydrofolate reductase family protein [Thermoleophilaceae bacterium]